MNSERRKLSVEAKISPDVLGFRKIPASILRGFWAMRFGMTGNFSALAHLNFVVLLAVVNLRLPHFSSSTITSRSCTSAI